MSGTDSLRWELNRGIIVYLFLASQLQSFSTKSLVTLQKGKGNLVLEKSAIVIYTTLPNFYPGNLQNSSQLSMYLPEVES